LGKVYNTETIIAPSPKFSPPAPVISAPQPKLAIVEVPKTITAHAPPTSSERFIASLKVEAPVLTAVKMERSNRIPPKQTKLTTPKSGWGIILDTTISLDGDKWYTKILTELPDKDGNRKWTTILAYKPAGKMPLYAECEFTLGSHNGRPTAVDVVVVSEDTPTKTFFNHLTGPDVVAHQTQLKQVYLQDLIAIQLESTLVGATTPERVKNFLTANGIISILGTLPDGSLVVQMGRENTNPGSRNSH
jgi:hypothetical protein